MDFTDIVNFNVLYCCVQNRVWLLFVGDINGQKYCGPIAIMSWIWKIVFVTKMKPNFYRKDLSEQLGIELSFVATRSGLTRWKEHKEKDGFYDEYAESDPDNP